MHTCFTKSRIGNRSDMKPKPAIIYLKDIGAYWSIFCTVSFGCISVRKWKCCLVHLIFKNIIQFICCGNLRFVPRIHTERMRCDLPLRACVSVSLQALFGKYGTSPWDFGYMHSPLPSCACLLAHAAVKGCWKKDWLFGALFGAGTATRQDASRTLAPVGLCSEDVWASVFCISNVLWMNVFPCAALA